MNIGSDKKILAKDSRQQLWLFYLGEGQKLCFKRTNQQAGALLEGVLDERPAADFWVDTAPNGSIHILLFTLSRFLVYLSSVDGEKWHMQTLSRVTIRSQTLNDLFILAQSKVHIMYVVQNAFRRSTEAIVHYIWDGDEWTGRRVWEFSSEERTRLHQVLPDSNGGHIVFYSQYNDKNYQMMQAGFSKEGYWDTPSLLYTASTSFQHFNALLDNRGDIHCCWSSNYHIYYNGTIISKENTRNTHPCLFYNDNTLSCTWLQDGSPVTYYSENMGDSWKHQKKLQPSEPVEFYYYVASQSFGSRKNMVQLLTPPFPNIRFRDIEPSKIHSVYTENKEEDLSGLQTKSKEEDELSRDYNRLITRLDSWEESINQHTYRLHQLEEKVFNHQRAIFTLEAQVKKLLADTERLRRSNDQVEAIKVGLQAVEQQLRNLKKKG
ncbi:MAG: hypothetical protein ACOX6S_03235 [Clostridia bacterium]|jgi:hypothetical protein